jgi:hypothetical protein
MKKTDLLKLIEYVEDDAEIYVGDIGTYKSYDIIGMNPIRTTEFVYLKISERFQR